MGAMNGCYGGCEWVLPFCVEIAKLYKVMGKEFEFVLFLAVV